jgi:hypothetical protein
LKSKDHPIKYELFEDFFFLATVKLIVLDSRIDIDVDDVHDQIDEDIRRRDDEDAALDRRIVPP